jgi:hypothetical protein
MNFAGRREEEVPLLEWLATGCADVFAAPLNNYINLVAGVRLLLCLSDNAAIKPAAATLRHRARMIASRLCLKAFNSRQLMKYLQPQQSSRASRVLYIRIRRTAPFALWTL